MPVLVYTSIYIYLPILVYTCIYDTYFSKHNCRLILVNICLNFLVYLLAYTYLTVHTCLYILGYTFYAFMNIYLFSLPIILLMLNPMSIPLFSLYILYIFIFLPILSCLYFLSIYLYYLSILLSLTLLCDRRALIQIYLVTDLVSK